MSTVFIAIPNLGNVSRGIFNWSHNGFAEGHEVKFFTETFRPSSMAHRMAQKVFLKSGMDWFLKLDADMTPPPDLLGMIDHGVDVCSANVRTCKGTDIIRLAMRETSLREFAEIPGEGDERGLIECDAVGSGCLLASRAAMTAAKFPHVTDKIPGVDFEWCRRVRAKGFRVWFDVRRRCVHNTIAPL